MAKDLEVQRCQLKYDLAKLDLQLLKHPQHFTTRLHYLEAKVERFGDEILALDQRISKLEPLRGVLP